MTLRFQADNDLDQRIVLATRRLEPTIDFQTAPALGLHGRADPGGARFSRTTGSSPGDARSTDHVGAF